MENKKFYVSYTKLDTYKKCPMQYNYKYLQGLEKRVSKRSLYIGEHIHKLLELLLVHKTPDLLASRKKAYEDYLESNPIKQIENIESLSKEELDYYNEKVECAKELYGNTLTWREYLSKFITKEYDDLGYEAKNELGYDYINSLIKIIGQYEYYYSSDKIKVLDIEHKKYANLGEYNGKEVTLVYICDGIVEVNGEQYILEHKSYSSTPMSFEETWLNVQTALYVKELNKIGWNIKGVIWDNIKSIAPKDPNILKNGSYGKHYNTHTLFSFISCDTIMEGPEAVEEAMNKLMNDPVIMSLGVSNNYEEFLSRHVTVFKDTAVDAIIKDSSQVIDTITKDNVPTYRNMGYASCNGCVFKEICQQEMLGNDTKELISTLYKKAW